MDLDRRQLLVGSAAIVAARSTRLAAAATPGGDPALKALLDETADAILAEFPDNATFFGVDTGARVRLRSQLTDRSAAADRRRAAACDARLAKLRAFDASRLQGTDLVDLYCAIYAHERASEGYRFPYGDVFVLDTLLAEYNSPYVVNHNGSVFNQVPDFLDNIFKVAGAADGEAYLARLAAFAQELDDETARMNHDAAGGVMLPDFLMDTALKQETAYAAVPIAHWGLVTSLVRRMREQQVAGDWEARAMRICEARVAPALQRQIDALKALRPKATADAGVWKLPQGDAYYAWALKLGTTTDMSADEVHRLGLDQVRVISAEMDTLLRKQGLSEGSVGARMAALGKDPRFLYPDSDAGRAALLAYLNGRIAAVRAKLPQAFTRLHKADLEIKRVPPSIEAGAPDGYELDGAIDGSRPATYYINLRDMGNWPKFSLPTLCFHEGLPGHVWQGSFAHDLPLIRSMLQFNAYAEGWALYSEQLGDELGMYADDPFGRLGYLQSIQFRAVRLVVDTGLHAKRWTRDQAIRWMVDNNGNAYDAARGEIDRYCAWPGQACGYQIGHLHIDGLREQARAKLGPRFDVRRFNDVVVQAGSVPLTELDRIVDGWMA
ncbi:MAG: DUF885 family protein [Sphingomonadaceae bacterium]|nr:DUF885 family protein [Sphingomonadaceae bacterium]